MAQIADITNELLSHAKPDIVAKTGQPSKTNCVIDQQVLLRCQSRVKELLSRFPLYPEIQLEESNQNS
jgi:glycine hydroxymethyltransferase